MASEVNDGLCAILARPDLMQRFQELATYVRPMGSDELAAFIGHQQDLWRPVLARIGTKSAD
jgi:tripartite-type tricarboxylate transporter receptor subunit TctC